MTKVKHIAKRLSNIRLSNIRLDTSGTATQPGVGPAQYQMKREMFNITGMEVTAFYELAGMSI